MGTGGSYTFSEQTMMYRVVQSLCCVPETYVTLYVNYSCKKAAMEKGQAWLHAFQ